MVHCLKLEIKFEKWLELNSEAECTSGREVGEDTPDFSDMNQLKRSHFMKNSVVTLISHYTCAMYLVIFLQLLQEIHKQN